MCDYIKLVFCITHYVIHKSIRQMDAFLGCNVTIAIQAKNVKKTINVGFFPFLPTTYDASSLTNLNYEVA